MNVIKTFPGALSVFYKHFAPLGLVLFGGMVFLQTFRPSGACSLGRYGVSTDIRPANQGIKESRNQGINGMNAI